MASASAAAAQAPAATERAMTGPTVPQLLSFVFASADMVLEIEDRNLVTFATGAAMRLLSRSADSTLGRPWRELFEPADAELVEAALRDVRPGAPISRAKTWVASGLAAGSDESKTTRP